MSCSTFFWSSVKLTMNSVYRVSGIDFTKPVPLDQVENVVAAMNRSVSFPAFLPSFGMKMRILRRLLDSE